MGSGFRNIGGQVEQRLVERYARFVQHEPRAVAANRDAKTDVLQGTLDLMVLHTLEALGPSHGYAVASRLEQVSSGALQLNMGTLYPALMRLEQRGYLKGAWGTTDSNRRARFYSLTAAGRRQLAAERDGWERMTAIMHNVLRNEV